MEFKHPKYYKEMRKIRRAQALKLTSSQASGRKPASPELRGQAQARVIQFQDQGARVQAKVPKLRGTGNKDKGIFWISYMK